MNFIQLFFTVITFATFYAVHTNSLILSRQNTGVCWYSNCPGLPPLGHTAAHRCCLTAALHTDLLSPCSVPLRPFCDVHAEAKKKERKKGKKMYVPGVCHLCGWPSALYRCHFCSEQQSLSSLTIIREGTRCHVTPLAIESPLSAAISQLRPHIKRSHTWQPVCRTVCCWQDKAMTKNTMVDMKKKMHILRGR